MRFEWDSENKVFKYRDNPRAEKILKMYNGIKKETFENYGVDKLREIMNTFLSAVGDYQSKSDYSSNTLKFLKGLNEVEKKLGRKETTLERLDALVDEL